MSVLDPLVGTAIHGAVGGVGIQATLEDWQRVLGTDFIDDPAKKRFRRDYGLAELGFWRVDGKWRCGSLALQVHRLWYGADDIGPASLKARYGGFPAAVSFADLRSRLTGLTRIADSDTSEYERCYVSRTKVTIMVMTTSVDGRPPGSVWALHLTDEPDIALRPHWLPRRHHGLETAAPACAMT